MLTHLPGFQDPIHDSQQTFRALLDALARPGLPQSIPQVAAPSGLVSGCAAAALTLLDLETTVWLQPGLSKAVHGWLLFHTGCKFTDHPHTADFALIWDVKALPNLDSFHWGHPEYPEASTSLLLQLPNLSGGDSITLRGPGILREVDVGIPVADDFWVQWQAMTACYPIGLDSWCFSGNQVLGLPRTARPDIEEN
jgi:alpha-D-ribose 1-methylphosphonate 5-triphosphate synthase subunit PhnH